MEKSNKNHGIWKRMKPFIYPHKNLLLLSLIIVPIVSLLNLSQPYLMKVAIDEYILPKNPSGLKMISLIYLGVFSIEYVLNFLQIYILQLTGQKIIFDLRRSLFSKVQTLDAKYFDHTPVGITLTRLTGDCEIISDLFSSGIVSLGWDFFRLVLTIVAMAILDWRLTLIAFSVVPVLLVVVLVFRKLLRKGYDLVRRRLADLNVFIQEHVGGIQIIQLFNKEEQCSQNFYKVNKSYRDANMTTIRYDAYLYAFVEALSSFAVGLLIWFGAGSLVKGLVTFGVLVAFIEYIQRFFIPIRDLSSKFAIIQSARVSIDRIFSLLEHPVTISSAANPLKAPLNPGHIQVKNLFFGYEKNKVILEDLSFVVKKGERIAIVGATGSGKSTLFKLLNRFYEISSGEILVDGQNIKNYSLIELRKLFSIVPQDVFLFTGSIADNIRLFQKKYSIHEVMDAAKKVGAHTFINRFSRQYEQMVAPRGSNLSMGEKQLIAMARGVIFNSPILLLDEATAHIDPQTTQIIQNGIDEISQERTLFVAAHRMSTVRHLDRILVFHKGKISESGTHEELVKRGGLYAQLYQLDAVFQ